MMNRYSTDYPNQLHQLMVSVSKHYWITKDGIVKYQQKVMDVRLGNIAESPKAHVVHYVVRDHFSGLFYARIASSRALMQPMAFLTEAWSEKPDFAFRGKPDYLAVPDTIEAAFPGTRDGVTALGVDLLPVTSGFQGGIRDIRTLEDHLAFTPGKSFDDAARDCLAIARYYEKEKSNERGLTKAELWLRHLPGNA